MGTETRKKRRIYMGENDNVYRSMSLNTSPVILVVW